MTGEQAPTRPAAVDGHEQRPLRHVILSVGRSRFTRCIGCYNHFGADPDAVVPAADVHAFLAHLRGTLDKVTVGGGDPLSRADVVDLLAGMKGLGFAVNLDTVGTPLLGTASTVFYGRRRVEHVPVERLASYVDVLRIPLDGSTEQVATTFRTGRAHLVDETLAILDLLDEAGVATSINTVVPGDRPRCPPTAELGQLTVGRRWPPPCGGAEAAGLPRRGALAARIRGTHEAALHGGEGRARAAADVQLAVDGLEVVADGLG